MSSYEFFIEVPLQSEWKSIDLIRTSVQNCLTAIFRDLDGSHVVAMVTGELLENAIKYGDWSGESSRFRLRITGSQGKARVTVENPVKRDDPGVAEVLRTIRWIDEFPTPAEAYRAKLVEVASATASDLEVSRLGLVRIAYEGNCRLKSTLADNLLRITAEIEVTAQASEARDLPGSQAT